MKDSTTDAMTDAMTDAIQETRRAFDAFLAQDEKDPASAADLLNEAFDKAEKALEGTLTRELAHLAHDIYGYKGRVGWEKRVQLHRRYLKSGLDVDERYWSHWEMADALAALKRNLETIEEMKRLFQWARAASPHHYALEALSDTSQAACWTAEGRLDEWFQLYEEAGRELNSPEVSRRARCVFLQSWMEVCMANGMLDDALRRQAALEQANGDPDWSGYFEFWLACVSNRLIVHGQRNDWDPFSEAEKEARAYIEAELQKRNDGEPVDISQLWWACHDVGCCILLWAKRYRKAAYFLEKAVEVEDARDIAHAGTHLLLAAAVWAGGKERGKALHHLKKARDFALNQNPAHIAERFLEMPEFAGVREDAEFRAAAGLQ